jgi:hypothetical protein
MYSESASFKHESMQELRLSAESNGMDIRMPRARLIESCGMIQGEESKKMILSRGGRSVSPRTRMAEMVMTHASVWVSRIQNPTWKTVYLQC